MRRINWKDFISFEDMGMWELCLKNQDFEGDCRVKLLFGEIKIVLALVVRAER